MGKEKGNSLVCCWMASMTVGYVGWLVGWMARLVFDGGWVGELVEVDGLVGSLVGG